MKYKKVVVGGTFDYLHKGHESLLTKAFEVGEKVWLGITSDDYIRKVKSHHSCLHLSTQAGRQTEVKSTNKKLKRLFTLDTLNNIHNLEERKTSVSVFLKQNGWLDKCEIVEIHNQYGTTLEDSSLEAIIVSPETKSVAVKINSLRQQKRFPELKIIEIPWVLAQDGLPINSVRIRAGQIDRMGQLYYLDKTWGVRSLPQHLRSKLKQPLGKFIHLDANLKIQDWKKALVKHFDLQKGKRPVIFAVGDVVTEKLYQASWGADISIVDFYVERKKVHDSLAVFNFPPNIQVANLVNPAGTLSYTGFKLIQQLIINQQFPSVVLVDGEEDLLALLVIIAVPLESLVFYGQPRQEGVVVIKVDELIKDQVREWLGEFEQV